MSTTGWLFVLIIMSILIGGLYTLYKTAYGTHISEEKMKRIKQRQAELEAEERKKDNW